MRLVHSIGIVRGRAGGPAPRVEQARGARSHLLFDRVLHVARRNNGKTRARRCGAGRLEHHFRLSISRSPKGLLSPIAHAHCRVQCRRLHFGAFRAQAIIDEENRPRRRVRRPARAESSVSPAIICNSRSDCARADCDDGMNLRSSRESPSRDLFRQFSNFLQVT